MLIDAMIFSVSDVFSLVSKISFYFYTIKSEE